MNRKMMLGVGSALVLAALVLLPASAGGWAVVTLDSLPSDMSAGTPTEIGFTVRQHGVTPRAGLNPPPFVEARLSTTGEVFGVDAKDSGPAGHYIATLILPSAGTWTWGIRGFGDQLQPMPPLHVLSVAGMPPPRRPSPTPWLVLAGAAATAGFVLLSRRSFRLATAAMGAAVVLGAAGAYVARPGDVQGVEAASTVHDADGAGLFLAKGCVVCHIHDALPESAEISLSVGPNLSAYHNSPEFLRAWLADPAGVRPETKMPDLGLSASEIDALISFLNQDR